MNAVIFLTSILTAAPIAIDRCEPADGVVQCDVTNTSETAVAAFQYTLTASEPGRAVPLVSLFEAWQAVPGGIEPTETVRMKFDSVPDQATEISVSPVVAFDVDHQVIGQFDERAETKMGNSLEDALKAF